MASKDQAIRDAAAALKKAIVEGREDGFTVDWPLRADDIDRIAVSQTGKARVVAQIDVRSVAPEVAEKAAAAAQKAADKEVEKAAKA